MTTTTTRGGARPGAGRPSTGIVRKAYSFKLTTEEHAKVKEFVSKLHKETNNK